MSGDNYKLEPAPGVDDSVLLPDGETILAVLRSIKDIPPNVWNILASVLALSEGDIGNIKHDNTYAMDVKKAFIKKWLERGTASWAILVSALRDPLVKENAIANTIAKDHPKKGENGAPGQCHTSSKDSGSVIPLVPSTVEKNEATPTSILDKKPSLKDAFNMLRDHSSQWDDIGLQLDIPFDKRTEWHRDGSLTNEQRLQRMLIHWFEGGCHTPVTWSGLIEILKESHYMVTAEKIETFLKTEKAQKTYK